MYLHCIYFIDPRFKIKFENEIQRHQENIEILKAKCVTASARYIMK